MRLSQRTQHGHPATGRARTASTRTGPPPREAQPAAGRGPREPLPADGPVHVPGRHSYGQQPRLGPRAGERLAGRADLHDLLGLVLGYPAGQAQRSQLQTSINAMFVQRATISGGLSQYGVTYPRSSRPTARRSPTPPATPRTASRKPPRGRGQPRDRHPGLPEPTLLQRGALRGLHAAQHLLRSQQRRRLPRPLHFALRRSQPALRVGRQPHRPRLHHQLPSPTR